MKDGQGVRLSDVCRISSALIDPRQPRYLALPHVGGANIESATGSLIALKSAQEEGLKSGKFLFDDQMVLYSKIRPYLKKVARPDFRGVCSADIYPLSPIDGRLDRNFLFHLLLSPTFTDYAIAGSARAGMPKVNRDHLFAFEFHLPALPEQQRIAGMLDEAFDGIAITTTNAETNLNNARTLFESHLQSIFTQRRADWEERTLGALCSLFVDSAHRTPEYQAEGIPALRPRDVVNGTLTLSGAARVSKSEYEIQTKRHRPAPGDIVYSRELSYGWAARLPDSPSVCLSQGMCLFRPTSDLDSAFLLYVLNGSVGREQATRAAVGAAHPHINLGDIKAFAILLPPIEEQRRLVRHLDALAAEVRRLESVYQRKLPALEALKNSLLHQAFTGQL